MGVFDEIKQQEQQNLNTSDQVNDQVSDQAAAPVLTENVFAPVATDSQTMKDNQIQAFSRDWRQHSNDDLDQDIAAGFIKREDADPVRWKSAIETAKGLGYDEKSYDLIYDDLPEYQKQWKEKELRRYYDNCDTMKNMCITDKNFLNTLDDKTAKDLYDINFNLAVYGQPNEPNAVWAFGQRVAYQTGRSEKSIQTGKLAGNIRGKRGDERAAAIAAWRKEHDQLVRMPEIDTSGYGAEDFIMAAADQLPIMARTTGAVVGGTLAGGVAGAGVGSVVPVVGTAAGGVAGAKAGWVAGNALAAYESYQIEANSMTESLLDITDKDGLPLEDWVVDGASYAYGAIAAAIELVPMKAVTNTIPGMKNITKVGIKQALKEAVKDKTKRQVIMQIIKDYGLAVAGESAEEAAQQFTQAEFTRGAKALMNALYDTSFEQQSFANDLAESAEAAIQAGKATAVMAGASSATRVRPELRAWQRDQEAKQLKRGQEVKAQYDAQRMDEVAEAAQSYMQKPSAERATLKKYMQQAKNSSVYQDIYMSADDARAVMISEAVQKNKAALQESGLYDDIERQIEQADQLGTPVRIAFETFGSEIMASQELYAAFKDVIKTYENGITMQELRVEAEQRQQVRNNIEKAAKDNASDYEYAYQYILEQEAAGGIDQQRRGYTAEFLAKVMTYMAKETKQPINEVMAKYAPSFERSFDGSVGGGQTVQDIISTIRKSAQDSEVQNLMKRAGELGKRDARKIAKILGKHLDNAAAGDVQQFMRVVNAIGDMKLNIEAMTDEDIANSLDSYTRSGDVQLNITRDDADRVKSGIFSASEKALSDIQANGQDSDYVVVGGGRIPVQYQIVELNNMITSHDDAGVVNENYPQELQPRDRSRAASDTQIASIVNNFAPERVGQAEIATEGAPIVTPEGYVAVGNGRAMAIRQVYKNAEKAQTYKDYLAGKGYDLNGFEQPVLVRKLAIEMNNEQLKALVDDANTAGTMQYSDSENALRDADKMSGNLLDLLDMEADIDSAANRRFLNAFFAEVVPTAERNAYLDKDDKITRKGVERVENAIVAKLLPDARMLSILVENPDNNIRKVTKELAKAAPAIISFENDIAAGRINADYSIAADVSGAVDLLKRAKDRNVTAAEFIAMRDMFEEPISSSTQNMVQLFEKSTGATDFLNKIRSYIRQAGEQGDMSQDNMFGIQPVSKTELLDNLARQESLFQRRVAQVFQPTRIEKSNYIADLREAEQSTGNEQKLIRLGELPAVYKAIGIPAAKVNTDKKTVIKDAVKKHAVPMNVVETLPELYADPIMVFKALDKSTNKNSYVAVLDAFDKDGKQMIAAISPTNKEGGYHMITSFYGRKNIDNMINTAFAENKVRYVQDKKNSLLTGHNAYLSQANNNILQKSDIVKDNNIIFYQRADRDNLTGDLFAQPANEQGNPLPVSVKKQVDDLFSYAEKQDGVTKELPLFSTVGESKKIEKTYQSSKQIVDAGDSLLGNLKRNAKVYTWEELEGMNDLLRRKYVTKTYIYPRLTIDDLRGRGIDGRSAALVEYVYNALNVKPAKNVNDTLTNQKRFFDVIHRTMETVIEYAKAHKADIEAWQTDMGFNYDLFRAVFPSDETNPRLVFRGNKEYNTEALVAGGNKFLSALMISGYDLAKLDAIAKDFDKQIEEKDNSKANVEPWQKHFMVVKRAYQDSWFVVDNNGKSISRDLSFATQEKAAEFAKKAYELVKPYLKGQGETVDFSGMRTGLPRRQNDQNVNPEALMETFGFRGVNFGNWTKQSERQEFLNLTYDSLLDMTEILGIPPKAIGLEGKLGLAFGAQGRAGAAGHFMPEFNEINLTRKDGAGSLAHEWWHALDYYFGDQSLGKDYSGHAVLELDKQGNLRSETYEAIRNLYQQISTADMSDKEVEDRYEAQVRRTQFMINNRASEIKNKFARAKNSEQINKFIDDMVAQGKNYDATKDEKYLSDFQDMVEERRRTAELAGLFFDLQYRLRQLVKLDDNTSSWRKVSKYYDTAVKLNRVTKKKNGYWTQRTELGARAFASYINDKVASNGWYNFFLAGHAKAGILDEYSYLEALIDAEKTGKKADINNYMLPVYPADEVERTNINAAFDRLFKTIKVDENNNFRLYQNQKIDMEALGAYTPLERKILSVKSLCFATTIFQL